MAEGLYNKLQKHGLYGSLFVPLRHGVMAKRVVQELRLGYEIEAELPEETCTREDGDCDLCQHWDSYNNYCELDSSRLEEKVRNISEHIDETKDDCSLNYGIEVTILGQPVRKRLLGLLKKVNGVMLEHGCFTKDTCGGHVHFLFAYGKRDRGVNHHVPVGFVANTFEMFRMFQPELWWLTRASERMVGEYAEIIKCFSNNKYQSVRDLTRWAPDSDYFFRCNGEYEKVITRDTYESDQECRVFHCEFRLPDGTLNPVFQYNIGVLVAALTLKAARVFDSGLSFPANRSDLKEIDARLGIYDGEDEHNYHGISSSIKSKLRNSSKHFVEMLKPELDTFDVSVYNNLLRLAHKPLIVRAGGRDNLKGF